MIKSAAILDVLRSCSYIALDKTGTVTEGKLVCTNIVNAEDDVVNGMAKSNTESASLAKTPSKHQALCYAVDLSKRSMHPIANAIVEAGREHLSPEDTNCTVSDFELVPGYGVRGTILPHSKRQQPLCVTFGSFEFIQGQLPQEQNQSELVTAAQAVRHEYGNSVSFLTTHESEGQNLEWSAFCFTDELQSVSRTAVHTLQEGTWKNGKSSKSAKKHVAIVTGNRTSFSSRQQATPLVNLSLGDHVASAQSIGKLLDIQDILSERAPKDKLRFIEDMQASLKEKRAKQSGVLMVGDGNGRQFDVTFHGCLHPCMS